MDIWLYKVLLLDLPKGQDRDAETFVFFLSIYLSMSLIGEKPSIAIGFTWQLTFKAKVLELLNLHDQQVYLAYVNLSNGSTRIEV